MRDLLVHIDSKGGWRARVDLALTLARAHRGRLSAAYALPSLRFPMPTMSHALSESEVRSILAAPRARRDEARSAFEAQTYDSGVSASWQDTERPVLPWLLELAPYHTCLVLGPADEGEALTAGNTFRLLLGAGCPVLVVPPGTPSGHRFRRIALGWNASRESARAVRDALPLLAQAEQVTVVTIDTSLTKEASAPVSELRDGLARRGIESETLSLVGSADEAGSLLLAGASRTRADLLVMGGFGHSRTYEYWVGGATRDVLELADLPVLLSH